MNAYLDVTDTNLGARQGGSKTDLNRSSADNACNSTVPSQMNSHDFIRVTPIF